MRSELTFGRLEIASSSRRGFQDPTKLIAI
jgi:hypothetical protein